MASCQAAGINGVQSQAPVVLSLQEEKRLYCAWYSKEAGTLRVATVARQGRSALRVARQGRRSAPNRPLSIRPSLASDTSQLDGPLSIKKLLLKLKGKRSTPNTIQRQLLGKLLDERSSSFEQALREGIFSLVTSIQMVSNFIVLFYKRSPFAVSQHLGFAIIERRIHAFHFVA